jgi:nitrite reductase/ring-hydroxylating ferredoxin subunit
VSPALAFLGVSILGTWGLANIGLIAGGIILMFFPGDAATDSDPMLGGIVLLLVGVASMGVMVVTTMGPLMGMDPPLPLPAKKNLAHAKLTNWTKAGLLREFPDEKPKEVRLLSRRIVIIRRGDTAYAMNALCSHARLPIAGIPGAPIKPLPIQDDCVTCPFHGAKFEVETGRVAREPFDSRWNNDHPFLGKLQSGLFNVLSKPPAPKYMKPSMDAETMQTYPVRIEGGEVMVGLPERK